MQSGGHATACAVVTSETAACLAALVGDYAKDHILLWPVRLDPGGPLHDQALALTSGVLRGMAHSAGVGGGGGWFAVGDDGGQGGWGAGVMVA